MRLGLLPFFLVCILIFISIGFVAAQEGLELLLPCALGDSRPCGSNIGVCEQGVRHCVGGQWSEDCEGGKKPITEICDNELDDDCDGSVDECVTISEGLGFFLIFGGVILFIVSIILAKIT